MSSDRIAIVSMAGRFTGSGADLDRFWENVVAAADCSREVPPGRWVLPPDRCTDSHGPRPDRVATARGYFLDPFEPDLEGLNLDPGLVAELDPLFHLVLDVGNRAWRAARTADVDRSRVGVVLGNICLPTDRSVELAREVLTGPVRVAADRRPTHPFNRLPTALPAGLLATGLGLGGGSYTLDAACASSLYALKLAADELLAGRADAMLAGGCCRPDCLYTHMGFTQLRALSPSGRCAPFDRAADGLLVGEGAAVFVLKRLTDALRHGDTILAVIAGVGLSNDRHGNLLAPAREGQLRALRRAYEWAGWQPADVDLIECHATGTPLGDAVEFESLRELWGETGWMPGQCVIGSVKSTVGHLLTGAGAAAVAKVLLALRNRTLPPQANFIAPAAGLRYAGGPFRIVTRPEPWPSRSTARPRRAAVSGFGFGGVNAHLLLEEWPGPPARPVPDRTPWPRLVPVSRPAPAAAPRAVVPPRAVPVAVVGLAAHFGPWADLRAVQERVLGGTAADPQPKVNGWAGASRPCPPAFGIEELRFPTDRFRIPPREIEETLPQQLLLVQVAAAALDDSRAGRSEPDRDDGTTTGVFVGLRLDPNTTNFSLRWNVLAQGADEAEADAVSPPLTADRTIGALGSIAASRIARTFQFGGPSHTVCSEGASAARAVELGVRALQTGELDRAVVGGVDLACDPRLVLPGEVRRPGEGAAAFVLKRLADAERDGDRVYAVLTGIGAAGSVAEAVARAGREAGIDPATAVPFDAAEFVGDCGAASAAASLAQACLALWNEILPGPPPRYWLHDRADGPRRAVITARGEDGSHVALVLEEHAPSRAQAPAVALAQPLGARPEAVFVVDGATPADLVTRLSRLEALAAGQPTRPVEALARVWFRERPPDSARPLAVALLARSAGDLAELARVAADHLRTSPQDPLPVTARPALRDRGFYSPRPLGPDARVAFVYPGSGNHFDGMGRDLSAQWPEVLRRQHAENERLRSQFAPQYFWDGTADAAPPRDLLFGQVTVGALVSDLLVSLGLRCDALIGLSLGESAGLFGQRVWQDRDEMFRRMQRSPLFVSDLAPPYDAARRFWNLPLGQAVDWAVAVLPASADDVMAALRPGLRAYLLIVATPTESVIGGVRADVEKLAAAVGKPATFLSGVTLAHCEVAGPVEVPYRELHTLPVTAPKRLTVYSGAWGRSYTPTPTACADSITAGLLRPIDFPRVIEAAYRDGVRVFVEVGPGASCTRMIAAILGDRPHLARSAHAPRTDAVSQILRLVAHLAAERVPIDLAALYGTETGCVGHRMPAGPDLRGVCMPVGRPPRSVPPPPAVSSGPSTGPSVVPVSASPDAPVVSSPQPAPAKVPSPPSVVRREPTPLAVPPTARAVVSTLAAVAHARVLAAQAHESFLRLHRGYAETAARLLGVQQGLLGALARRRDTAKAEQPAQGVPTDDVPRSLTYEQCCIFAAGRIADVLGPRYAEIDTFPTRVRLPDGPLQLVDRIVRIEGEPLSLTRGRVVTEHTVRPDRWYLECDRIPTALAVEAGQADLFLAGFLGIDLRTRGRAVYRLLDAVVTFHRGLPRVGETVVYDIAIDRFLKQGDAWLFRFRFDGTIDGQPFLTMRDGVAGFFTAEELAAGRGIVRPALADRPAAGCRPADWRDLVPQQACALSADQVEALRAGDLVAAFGPEFAGLPMRRPHTLPGGLLRLVDRVPRLEPAGGRFGIGFVRGEFDIHPDDWFLTCHFVDDPVMPGTLMYECCLHTLRVLLLRLGWVGESGEVAYEPVPGVASRLKCRGQVTGATRTVAYEVTVKELGYRPEPFCRADALMFADGKPIVEITDLSVRLTGLTREQLEARWASGPARQQPTASPPAPAPPARRKPLYDSASILAFSNGNPSDAFGEPYRVFDRERVIARLPGPPFQFLDRIMEVTGEPFVLKAGAACVAEYDVPPTAWYFAQNHAPRMPFAVLLEVALQPCGWLAAYCGSALTSPVDLSFRNLGGRAVQFRPVGPDVGTLTTSVRLTQVSRSAGMIIQHFDMSVRDAVGPVYEGTTYFGFFSKAALANQVGLRDARPPTLTPDQRQRAETGRLPADPPFPGPMLRMVDRIEAYVPDGGRAGRGLVIGAITVDPTFWFFAAHFYQDPVWPGSLGLESFLQLLKYVAWRQWGPPERPWQVVALGRPHTWTYRGQVLPTDREVTVVAEVTARDDQARRLTADGFLSVDGRVIYHMTDFSLE